MGEREKELEAEGERDWRKPVFDTLTSNVGRNAPKARILCHIFYANHVHAFDWCDVNFASALCKIMILQANEQPNDARKAVPFDGVVCRMSGTCTIS